MTAIGMVVSADQAIVWADTLTFSGGGEPSRHIPKLILNPTARLAGAGTGWTSLLEIARREAASVLAIDDLVERLPAVLRHAAARLADRRSDPECFRRNLFVAAGYSPRYRRIVGWVFDAEHYFTPDMVRTICSPHVDDLQSMGAACEDDIGGVVATQIEILSRSHGIRIGGQVVSATLTPNGVAARTLLKLGSAFPGSGDQLRAAAPTAAEVGYVR